MARGMSRRTDAVWNPPGRTADITALFALHRSGAAPAARIGRPAREARLRRAGRGPRLHGRALPRAARRVPARRVLWYALAAGAGSAAVASALGLVASSRRRIGHRGFLRRLARLGRPAARRGAPGPPRAAGHAVRRACVEALILITLIAALGVWFVAMPGFSRGDALLTALFLVDLVALALAALAAVGGRDAARVGGRIALGCAIASAGDGLVAVESAGRLGGVEFVAPLLWAAAGVALTAAADGDVAAYAPRACARTAPPPAGSTRGWCSRSPPSGDARDRLRAPSRRRPERRSARVLRLLLGRAAACSSSAVRPICSWTTASRSTASAG